MVYGKHLKNPRTRIKVLFFKKIMTLGTSLINILPAPGDNKVPTFRYVLSAEPVPGIHLFDGLSVAVALDALALLLCFVLFFFFGIARAAQ